MHEESEVLNDEERSPESCEQDDRKQGSGAVWIQHVRAMILKTRTHQQSTRSSLHLHGFRRLLRHSPSLRRVHAEANNRSGSWLMSQDNTIARWMGLR